MSHVIAKSRHRKLAHGTKPKTKGVSVTDRWTWCDALYMAPPTLARLHTATGDRKYLDFLDREFQFTYDHLYDPEEKLFSATRLFEKKTPNGKKTFWSRGNGWVYGGLALMLEHLPKGPSEARVLRKPLQGNDHRHPRRAAAGRLVASKSAGPEEIALGETSGSGFFTFGLAWGVNTACSTAPPTCPPSPVHGTG
jgi:unsaturated rhamnogalacturonyl hydrolase